MNWKVVRCLVTRVRASQAPSRGKTEEIQGAQGNNLKHFNTRNTKMEGEETQIDETPCCSTHRALTDSGTQIIIADAQKTTDLTGSSFVVYLVRTLDSAGVALLEVKRRYSEFESLKKSLQRIYPTIIVPTLPEKNSIGSYASKQGKAKEDPHLIAKRKRMLASFINRVATHPILCGEHMFHRFLENGLWNDVLAATPVPKERKSPLKRLIERKTPKNPGTLSSISNSKDAHWSSADAYTSHYIESMATTLRAAKNALADVENACSSNADLGAIYNGWSLHESTPGLAQAIERFGQACDASQKYTGELYQHVEEKFVEPLQEQQQLAAMVAKVLKWRSMKQIEFEDAIKSLESAKSQLEALETSEKEAQRLQAVLNRHIDAPAESTAPERIPTPEPTPEVEERPPTPTESAPESAVVSPSKRTVPSPYDVNHVVLPPKPSYTPGGILSSINSLLDNDPESTRRATISRLREKILQYTEKKSHLSNEVLNSNLSVQSDLDRYQKDKIDDWRRMMVDFCRGMKRWSECELETWKGVCDGFE